MPATLVGPRQILVIRHGEKPGFDGDGHGRPGAAGVQEDGTANPHSLTARGWQRAGALAVLLGGAGGPSRAGLNRPSLLLAPDYGAQNPNHRTLQTIQPLADLLDLTIGTPCPHGAGQDLVDRHVMVAAEAVVLICWDHQNLPDVLQALHAAAPVRPWPVLPATGWPDDRYDAILSFTRSADAATYRFEEIPQSLLRGDSTTAITSQQ